MRALAERVGISNPYLSQIERGLRAPSDQVLDSIARALKTTSRALYEAAGLTPPGAEADDIPDPAVLIALREDALLSDTQRRALEAVYRAFTEGKVPVRRGAGAGSRLRPQRWPRRPPKPPRQQSRRRQLRTRRRRPARQPPRPPKP